jgi:hypothetical protein
LSIPVLRNEVNPDSLLWTDRDGRGLKVSVASKQIQHHQLARAA